LDDDVLSPLAYAGRLARIVHVRIVDAEPYSGAAGCAFAVDLDVTKREVRRRARESDVGRRRSSGGVRDDEATAAAIDDDMADAAQVPNEAALARRRLDELDAPIRANVDRLRCGSIAISKRERAREAVDACA